MGTAADAGDDQVVSCSEVTLGGANPTAIDFLWVTTDGTINSDPDAETIQVNSPGTYLLQITDSNGCTGTDEVVVTGAPGLDAALEVTDPNCIGESGVVLITSTQSDVMYSIDNGESFSDSGLFQNIAPGTYTMVVRDGICPDVTQTFTVTAPDLIANDGFAGQDLSLIHISEPTRPY